MTRYTGLFTDSQIERMASDPKIEILDRRYAPHRPAPHKTEVSFRLKLDSEMDMLLG